MSEAKKESPLVERRSRARPPRDGGQPGVRLGERAFLGHVNVRGRRDSARFLETVAAVAGVSLPEAPNGCIDSGERAALWLGPEEWLILTERDGGAGLARALREALADEPSQVNDLSGGQTVIHIAGRHALDVLAKGTPLDVERLAAGACAQTHLAKANVCMRPRVDADSALTAYELIVRRSFADYLWRWLEDAASEYGYVAVMPDG